MNGGKLLIKISFSLYSHFCFVSLGPVWMPAWVWLIIIVRDCQSGRLQDFGFLVKEILKCYRGIGN
ncbi:MAG: hypothetical protein AMJ79_15370 [Phycisphaerae bacterium SM23_30]|nr:MAG: hypothetical protein AMJ79_15370 [Phycisphaerae bacterium SM23_30]